VINQQNKEKVVLNLFTVSMTVILIK